ncbi:glycosyltransferase [Nocardia terpenica]|uniref:Glycosyl transferase n=1 Tax=Nocardia terpenica TaxID=455432 RepID=A0A164L0Z5_9NOCA|nr:glycosyltransferase [Nocardia terpenica]KZM71909.1 glycosyl transferase [Nocardia terpenica]NQE86527.1 glycosyltransferase family 1 protein [Nocardia terpenica]
MSRYLFVVPPLVGHINPLVGVSAALTEQGHQVAWAGPPEMIRQLAGGETIAYPACGWDSETPPVQPLEYRSPAIGLKLLWEKVLVPLADAMAPGVSAAIADFVPDVLVVDQHAVAGALIAQRFGLPWATSATTPADLVDPLAGLPKVQAWLTDLVRDLRQRIGDPTAEDADPRFSPHLVLAFTTDALVGPDVEVGEQIRFVGPSVTARPSESDFPWDWLDPARQTVLITLGTICTTGVDRFLTAAAEAIAARAERLQAVIVDPGGVLGALGPNILVRPRVPQVPLLAKTDAVICHAGHNTVCESLWHGLPLVMAPIVNDESIVASQVVRAGAGIRVRFNRATTRHLGDAVDAVLTQPHYSQAAAQLQRSFRSAGGACAAAAELETFAARTVMPNPST